MKTKVVKSVERKKDSTLDMTDNLVKFDIKRYFLLPSDFTRLQSQELTIAEFDFIQSGNTASYFLLFQKYRNIVLHLDFLDYGGVLFFIV